MDRAFVAAAPAEAAPEVAAPAAAVPAAAGDAAAAAAGVAAGAPGAAVRAVLLQVEAAVDSVADVPAAVATEAAARSRMASCRPCEAPPDEGKDWTRRARARACSAVTAGVAATAVSDSAEVAGAPPVRKASP